jgi:F-type H+-transporting ATPase subunit b
METTTAVVGHDSANEGGGLFSIDPGLMIWTWVVFGLLLIVLRKFAWKPMMESVEKRETMMAQAVEQAQKTKEELDRIAQKQAEILREAQDEARKIISDGRVAAEATARRIDEEAQAHARKTIDSAREQLTQEKELALREIRQQSVDLIISASEQLIGDALNNEDHRRIVEKHLEEW